MQIGDNIQYSGSFLNSQRFDPSIHHADAKGTISNILILEGKTCFQIKWDSRSYGCVYPEDIKNIDHEKQFVCEFCGIYKASKPRCNKCEEEKE
jgi:hypothetical protein